MDSSKEEDGPQRTFGLPSWMVNNFERLNYVTDFEQYGCSPPEGESFLNDFADSAHPNDLCVDSTVESKNLVNEAAARMSRSPASRLHLSSETDSKSGLYLHSPPAAAGHLLGRHEELFSSPDNTPCATPEPSPVVPRRKVSIPQPHDTVLTNPGRWFYLGKVRKPEAKKKPPVPQSDKPGKAAIKLVISNFDMNAVSPTSW